MKLRKFSSIILLTAFSLFLFSCEGDVFETDAQIIEQISKTWTAVENNGTTYDIVISAKSATEINMTNFNSYPTHVTTATVSGQTITIKAQEVDADVVIYGTGTIADGYGSISFSYTEDVGGTPESYTASLTEYDPAAKKAEKVQ